MPHRYIMTCDGVFPLMPLEFANRAVERKTRYLRHIRNLLGGTLCPLLPITGLPVRVGAFGLWDGTR